MTFLRIISPQSRVRRSRILYRRVLTECGGYLPPLADATYEPLLDSADLLGCELLKPVRSRPVTLALTTRFSPCEVRVTRLARFLFRVKLLQQLSRSSSESIHRLSWDCQTEELAPPFLELVVWFWGTMWPATTLG